MQSDCPQPPVPLDADLTTQVAELTQQLAAEKVERYRLEELHQLTPTPAAFPIAALDGIEPTTPASRSAVVGIDVLEREQLIAAIAQRIRQSLNLDDILSTTATEVRQFLGTDRVVLYQFTTDWNGKITVESVGDRWMPILGKAISDSCIGEAYIFQYQQGRTRVIEDIFTADLEPCHIEFLAQLQVRANLVVPILQSHHLWGLLIAHHCAAPRQWQPWEVNFLERLAVPVGIAIKQANLYRQLEVELTERRQAEIALRFSEERFRTLVQNIPGAVYRYRPDPGWTLEFISEAIEAIVGYPSTDFIHNQKRRLNSIVHPDDRLSIRSVVEQSLRAKQPYEIEYRVIHINGEIHWVIDQGQGVFGAEGELIWLDGVINDISDRKQAEAEILKALAREKELSDLRSRFVSMTSHEFRTPLTIISSSAQLLEHYDWPREEQIEQLHQIQSAVQHMVQLLEGVLTLGKAEAGKFQFQPRTLDLVKLCQTVVSEMQCSLQERHLLLFQSHTVTVQGTSLPLAHCLALVDETLIRQILNNLLVNAIKYSPKGGVVQLRLLQLEQAIIFEIEDEGIGIPAKDQTMLFTSFYRGTNVEAVPGTGLGLAIVKKCVELHRGAIAVQSQVGVGTKFTITLSQTS